MNKKHIALFGALLVSFVILYRNVILKLVNDWSIDENYSHGFLVAPIALYFAWERRQQLLSTEIRPSVLGLVAVLLSMAMLLAGVLGAEIFTTEVSMLGVLGGTVLFLGGWGVPFSWFGWDTLDSVDNWMNLAGPVIMLSKMMALTLIIMWVRFSYPRFREDQLQRFAWKVLIPLSLLNIVVTAVLKVAV